MLPCEYEMENKLLRQHGNKHVHKPPSKHKPPSNSRSRHKPPSKPPNRHKHELKLPIRHRRPGTLKLFDQMQRNKKTSTRLLGTGVLSLGKCLGHGIGSTKILSPESSNDCDSSQ